jgi:hypothetical protein
MELTITKAEVDELMDEPKSIEQTIEWNRSNNNEFVFEFRVPVRQKMIPGAKLILKASTNIALNKHTFAIIYNGAARIKALDIGKKHKNKCSQHPRIQVGIKHKHTWQDCCRDRWAYVPDDITDGAPFEQVFQEFLAECNIKYEGSVPEVPTSQMELMWDEMFDD